MKILAVGVDIIKISRIAKVVDRYPGFVSRILSTEELSKCRAGYGYIARRWAGKEAISKAIGTGFRTNCKFSEISILNDDLGSPYVKLSGDTGRYIEQTFPGYHLSISLSDDEYAIGYCVLIYRPTTVAEAEVAL